MKKNIYIFKQKKTKGAMQGRKHLAYAAFKNPSDEGSLSQRHDVGCDTKS